MSPKRLSARKLFVLALGAATALSLAAPAGAAKNIKVRGTLQFSPPSDFHGSVRSSLYACEYSARVNLWRFDNAADTTRDKLGTAKTNRKGAWEIMVSNAQAGEYQIQILGRKVQAEGQSVRCEEFVGLRLQF